MAIFDFPYLCIGFLPEVPAMHLVWKGSATTEEHHLGWDTALAYAIEHNVTYWLIDHSKRRVPNPDDTGWLLVNWVPRHRQALGPMRGLALIEAEDALTQLTTDIVVNQLLTRLPGTVFKYFREFDPAKAWLLSLSAKTPPST